MARLDNTLAATVRQHLADLEIVSFHRFFGGLALRCGHVQFGMVMGDSLYLAVDESTRVHYEAAGTRPFRYSTRRGVVTVNRYLEVPRDVIDDETELCRWAADALEVAAAAAATVTRRRC